MDYVIYLVLAASILALGFAFYFYKSMLKEDEGTDLMKKIALHVRNGAMAYLKQQYKVVIIVFIILAAIFGVMAIFNLQNEWVWFAFLTGGFFSGLAGFFGMKTATYASARTANAAKQSLNNGLKVAFRSGAVMGLTVVGLALLDISLWFIILTKFTDYNLVVITTTMLTFGMGASTQALFARVGGGIYTKPLTLEQTWSVRQNITFLKMTLVILPLSLITSVITSVTSPVWVPTFTSLTQVQSSRQQLSVQQLSQSRQSTECNLKLSSHQCLSRLSEYSFLL